MKKDRKRGTGIRAGWTEQFFEGLLKYLHLYEFKICIFVLHIFKHKFLKK